MWKNGFESLAVQTANAMQPPGFTTRRISRIAAEGSGNSMMPSLQTTTSNVSDWNGNAAPIHWVNSIFASSRLRASFRDARTISTTASVQTTDPDGPTASAIVIEGSPEPPATSSTE